MHFPPGKPVEERYSSRPLTSLPFQRGAAGGVRPPAALPFGISPQSPPVYETLTEVSVAGTRRLAGARRSRCWPPRGMSHLIRPPNYLEAMLIIGGTDSVISPTNSYQERDGAREPERVAAGHRGPDRL